MTASPGDVRSWLAAGWAIFPCHSVVDGQCSCGKPDCNAPGKHPRPHNGVKGASSDLSQIEQWLMQFPRANWAVATGAPSGIVVIDLDVKDPVDGIQSFGAALDGAGMTYPQTFAVRTGGGGRHLYFRTLGMPVRNSVGRRTGIDVRGDGGYVLLPRSTHISGGSYMVEDGRDAVSIPDGLLDVLGAGGATSAEGSAPSALLSGVDEGGRDDYVFRLACSLRRRLDDDREAVTTLALLAASRCTPPFSESEAMVKIDSAFAQDHSDLIDLDRVPFSAPDGDLYDFLTGLDADTVEAVERAVKQVKVRALAARVIREERVRRYGSAASTDGESFMFDVFAAAEPIWGAGDDLLWSEGGGLMIPSDQGLGKSLTAQQIIAGRLGVGPPHLLGLPIHPLPAEKLAVYLALDRPRQIARSMARMFRTDADRAVARDRLRVWTKPVPIDVLGDPYAFADWIQDTFGENVGDLVIDSVKDLTPGGISKDEVGQGLDMAWKECRARGMSTLLLHHERKTGNDSSRANRQPALDNIYGSVWLTSGMDSVLHIQGKQGENVVTYTHLKAIVNMLDPITAAHDQENGRTDVLDLGKTPSATEAKLDVVFGIIERRSGGGAVVTAAEIVSVSGIAKASVDRYIKTLRESGRIVEASPYDRASATPATYRVAD